jgi:phage terminase Nu1 subunit (DNA packaging protein)
MLPTIVRHGCRTQQPAWLRLFSGRWAKLLSALALSFLAYSSRPHTQGFEAKGLPGSGVPADSSSVTAGTWQARTVRLLAERSAGVATNILSTDLKDTEADESSELLHTVTHGAPLHGFVEKAGPLDPRAWQPAHSAWRQAHRQAWLQERDRTVAEGGWLEEVFRAALGCMACVPRLRACSSRV